MSDVRGQVKEKIVPGGIQGKFDFLEHTSDVYVVAYGRDPLELFSNAGLALFEAMVNTNKVERRERLEVFADGFDLENLLYKWIESLLTIYYVNNFMCGDVQASELHIARLGDETQLRVRGVCAGERLDPARHEPKVEVKAMTYSLMRILKDEGGWRAYFVLDI
ncbi:MAG: archease [Desulfurococcaceae archaeon]